MEFRLEVEGSEWRQGDTLNCELTVKNRGGGAAQLQSGFIRLCCGQSKKVKEKSADAFQTVAESPRGERATLAPGEIHSITWSVPLDVNCPVTDKSQSLYLVCGANGDENIAGNLQVNVLPHEHIDAVHTLLENTYCFVLKGLKSKNGAVEAKFKPPLGKLYPTVDHLLLSTRFVDGALSLSYRFQVKKLQATPASIELKKGQSTFEATLEPSKYLFPGGQINHAPLEEAIGQALKTVE